MSDVDDLRTAVRDLLTTHAHARSAMQDDPALWKRLAVEMGLTGLPYAGVPLAWIVAVLEESGRELTRAPLLSTLVAGFFIPGLEDASTTAALALDGDLTQVADAVGASALLVADGNDLLVVRDFTATPVDTLDLTRAYAAVVVNAPGEVVGNASAARDLHWLAIAAESVGGAQRLLELAVGHLKVREQFGRPLGSFQALRHRVADLTVQLESATSTTWWAAQDGNLATGAPLAKAAATDAFTTIAGECIQLFGGIGFTWEHDAHLYFKRAWTNALRYGDNTSLRRLAFERSGV